MTEPRDTDEHEQNDYLWDKSGPVDPEVARLEALLSSQRYRKPETGRVVPLRKKQEPIGFAPFAIAAALLLGILGGWWSSRRAAPYANVAPSGSLVASASSPAMGADAGSVAEGGYGILAFAGEGQPKIGDTILGSAWEQLPIGVWLETGPSARATITIRKIGRVEVEPKTRIRVLATGPDRHELELSRGTISARVVAPPRIFVVTTPAATAVDLGCAYTLRVDEQGNGLLEVTSGYVAWETSNKSSIVPMGAACLTRVGKGPGTPYFADAPVELRAALAEYDFEDGGKDSLDQVLAKARARDSLTLWHLLERVPPADRPRVYAKLAKLVPPPQGVTEPDIIRLDKTALDRWKSDLTPHW